LKLSARPEIAALLAAHGQSFAEQANAVSVQAMGDYYVYSRNRFNRWMRLLDRLEAGSETSASADGFRGVRVESRIPLIREVSEQILINEMLARVWTILLIAQDRHRSSSDSEALATNVLLGHQALRRRLLRLCRSEEYGDCDFSLRIEHLRRETEVWTDILCCPFMKRYDLWSFACDEEDARDYFRQRQERCALDSDSAAWIAMLGGLRESFSEVDETAVLVAQDDVRILRLMASCFPSNCTEINWLTARLPLGV
jgi:hypothetical protein